MFDLSGYMTAMRGEVDKALDEAMPSATLPPAVLHAAMRYSVFSGGKRLRPVLCLAAAGLTRPRHGAFPSSPTVPRAALRPAIALEFLHTYTLIHDDLPCMDDDAVRRGKPTCHVAFGEANAVLAGDALQALAFELLAGPTAPSPYPPGQLVMELAHAAGSRGVVGGQVEDIEAVADPLTPERLDFIHQHKTADLFRAAVRMGGVASGMPPEELEALSAYGSAFGLAFQLTDDLLDAPAGAPAAPQSAGKAEKQEATATALSLYPADEVRARASRYVDRALASLERFGPTAEPLRALATFVLRRQS